MKNHLEKECHRGEVLETEKIKFRQTKMEEIIGN